MSNSLTRVIFVEDNDTLIFRTRSQGPSMVDPADEYDGVNRAFRVVAEDFGPVFELVPVSKAKNTVARYTATGSNL